MDLTHLRKKIDTIDQRIVRDLNERARVSIEIGKQKRAHGASTYSPDRESAVYQRALSKNKGPLSDRSVRAIYREIMSGALSLEGPLSIAYLGPAATFTHLASIKKFGSSVEYLPVNSITDVFAEVEKGRAGYGVVPIENSTEGAISHTLDMFIESELKICSEISLEISHNLLGVGPLTGIKKIYSKAEVFGQCRQWLEANLPGVELAEASSTSKAAEIAKREKGAACVASILAADQYGLKVLAPSIEDYGHNVTRFLVIGRTEPKPTQRDKTSIMFSIKDRLGALHDILSPFKKYRINLTKIESRPSKKRAWDYYFFVDMQGHHEDLRIKKALKGLEGAANFVKVLGSYPAETPL
ncbi:MAG: prephenate dehydratase [Candidatus Omnitrophota bacterium]